MVAIIATTILRTLGNKMAVNRSRLPLVEPTFLGRLSAEPVD